MPRLSIVIPCLGGAAEFDGTLVSILQNRPPDCEVLVVHTESYNDPYKLSGEVRFIETNSGSVVNLLNIALTHTSGEVLHIIGCGLEATEHWTPAALAHFDDPDVAAVSPVVLGDDCQTVVAAGISWTPGGVRRVINDQRLVSPGSGRLRAKVLGPTLPAAFYRRDMLVGLGGFDTTVGDALADVNLALAIESLGRLHVCEPASRLIRISDPPAAPASGLASGRAAEKLFWRYAAKRGFITSLGWHPWSVAADAMHRPALSLLTSLVGRAAAFFEIGAVQRHDQQLIAAAEHLSNLPQQRTFGRKAALTSATAAGTAAIQHRRAA